MKSNRAAFTKRILATSLFWLGTVYENNRKSIFSDRFGVFGNIVAIDADYSEKMVHGN